MTEVLSARQKYEAITARVRQYVLDYCMANAEDWPENLAKIAAEMGMSVGLTDLAMQADVWSFTLAGTAMTTLNVVVPLYPDDWNGEHFTPEEHDAICRCMDCGVHTQVLGEYYCLENTPWYEATASTGGDGMLCIECIENRLGRMLTADDFKPGVPVNTTDRYFPRSERFLDRLSR